MISINEPVSGSICQSLVLNAIACSPNPFLKRYPRGLRVRPKTAFARSLRAKALLADVVGLFAIRGKSLIATNTST